MEYDVFSSITVKRFFASDERARKTASCKHWQFVPESFLWDFFFSFFSFFLCFCLRLPLFLFSCIFLGPSFSSSFPPCFVFLLFRLLLLFVFFFFRIYFFASLLSLISSSSRSFLLLLYLFSFSHDILGSFSPLFYCPVFLSWSRREKNRHFHAREHAQFLACWEYMLSTKITVNCSWRLTSRKRHICCSKSLLNRRYN